MSKVSQHRLDLEKIFGSNPSPADMLQLRAYLLKNSGLPGRRGNLELAHVFGNIVGDYADSYEDAYWQLCESYLAITAEEAPVNTAEEFLPFCGTVGIGSLGAVLPHRSQQSLAHLRRAASDSRWRMREAVAVGLQYMLCASPMNTMETIQSWINDGNPLEMRAAAAAVAEPLLLNEDSFITAALDLHRRIFTEVLKFDSRKSEAFRVLRKGLGYTLSVVVRALPDAGFAYLESLAGEHDPDVIWIIRENLKKHRLAHFYPDRVYHIKTLLSQ